MLSFDFLCGRKFFLVFFLRQLNYTLSLFVLLFFSSFLLFSIFLQHFVIILSNREPIIIFFPLVHPSPLARHVCGGRGKEGGRDEGERKGGGEGGKETERLVQS